MFYVTLSLSPWQHLTSSHGCRSLRQGGARGASGQGPFEGITSPSSGHVRYFSLALRNQCVFSRAKRLKWWEKLRTGTVLPTMGRVLSQWGYLLCKHEHLSSTPQHQGKSAARICNLSTGVSGTHWPARLINWRVPGSARDPISTNKRKSNRRL